MNKCTRSFPRAPSRAPAGISWRIAASRLSSTTCSPPSPRPGAAGRGATCAASLSSAGPGLLRGDAAGMLRLRSLPAAARAGHSLAAPRGGCRLPHTASCVSHVSADLKLDTNFLRKHFGFVFACRC